MVMVIKDQMRRWKQQQQELELDVRVRQRWCAGDLHDAGPYTRTRLIALASEHDDLEALSEFEATSRQHDLS